MEVINSIYQLLMEIPVDMILNIGFVIIIIFLIILGLILKINSTKTFLKALFNRFIIFSLILIVIWFGIIFMIFGNFLMKYYSFGNIVLTIIFSILILCLTSYKLTSEEYFIKNMFIDNFKFNAIFCVFMGCIQQIFTFNLLIYGIEFIKSLLLPVILEILFLPIMHLIAVINEYRDIKYLSSTLSEDIKFYDVFKKCNINLRCLYRYNRQLNYENSNGAEFKLIDNQIYMGNDLIGSYVCNVEIPEISGIMSEAYTVKKKINYIVGDSQLESLSEDFAFVYFKYKNTNIKLFIETKYSPMQIWSSLIEDIYEFGLL